jgi:transcription initiation factor TFIID subunit 6
LQSHTLESHIQDALKFAKHAKRTRLTTEDVNNALRLRGNEVRFLK